MSNLTQIKLIASDLDHTLLTEDGQLPPDFYTTIRQVHAAGIHFVAASGRPLYTLRPMFEPVKDCVSLVAENGAVVIRDGEMVYSQFIPKADYVRLINYTHAQKLGIPILCALDSAYVGPDGAAHTEFLGRFFKRLEVVDDLRNLDVQLAKYTVFYPEKQTYDVFEPDYATPLAADFHVTIGGDYFLDIMHKVVNKGHALTELGNLLAVTPAEMVAFGDNLNDTEMLQLAGHAYIVAAATDKLMPYATARIGSNSDYAVATMIQEILANGGQINE